MSAAAVGWVDDANQSGRMGHRERLLLRVLADYAADDGTGVYPYLDTLAGRLGWDERTVRRGLSRLRDLGLIQVDDQTPLPARLRAMRADRRPTVYRLNLAAHGGTRGDTSDLSYGGTRGDTSDRHGGTHLSPLYRGTKNRNNYRREDTSVPPSEQGSFLVGVPAGPPTCPACREDHYPRAECSPSALAAMHALERERTRPVWTPRGALVLGAARADMEGA